MSENTRHEHHWRAYGQSDGTIVCDGCNLSDDVNDLLAEAVRIGQAARELVEAERVDTLHFRHWQALRAALGESA